MNKQILIVCDSRLDYVSRLCTYISRKKDMRMEPHGFTDVAELSRFLENHKDSFLLISEDMFSENIEKAHIKQIAILVDEHSKVACEESEYPTIYKYQAVDELRKNILELYLQSNPLNAVYPNYSNNIKIIGIYSPIHRCFQTTFAMALGQILSEKSRTLYLNFESFSGFENMMGKRYGGNLTDLLYYYECDKEKLGIKLKSITHQIGDMDYIPPVDNYENYRDKKPEDWIDFIMYLVQIGGYEMIILDLSEHVQGLFQLLDICQIIYTIIRKDRMSLAKLAQYQLLLEKSESDAIWGKTRKVEIPRINNIPTQWEALQYTELYGYIRKLLQEGDLEK